MAESVCSSVGFNATVKSLGVTADDVATLDSVYGTRAEPIYVSCDEAIATKTRPVIVMRGVLLNCGKPDRDGDIIGDVALNDYSRAIIGPGTLQWAPLEVDEERLNQARQDLIEKFVANGGIDSKAAREMFGFTPTVRKSTDPPPPHDWPHESLLSSGEASQSLASESLKQTSPIYHKSYGSEVNEAIDALFDACKKQDLYCTVDISPISPKQEPHSLQSLPANGDAVALPVAAPPATAYNIDSVVDFASLIPVAHAMALDKGWWQNGITPRDMNEIIANYHAEVSEAWEEYRSGRMETWMNTDGKPEGFWVEIADLLIRVADACGAKYHKFSGKRDTHFWGENWGLPCSIVVLHRKLTIIKIEHADSVVDECMNLAFRHNVDLFAVVRQKLAYNATRPHRHGGKKA